MKPEEYPSETFYKYTIVTGVLENFERKKICTVRLEKQQGAWMNGVQNWGYSSLIINSKNFREHQLPKASSASSDGCTPVF